MEKRPADLPEFKEPPIGEVVFGLHFATAEPLEAPHIGLYWTLIQADFPKFSVHSPIASKIENLKSLSFQGLRGKSGIGNGSDESGSVRVLVFHIVNETLLRLNDTGVCRVCSDFLARTQFKEFILVPVAVEESLH